MRFASHGAIMGQGFMNQRVRPDRANERAPPDGEGRAITPVKADGCRCQADSGTARIQTGGVVEARFMKVFEVTTEHIKNDSKEIIPSVQYVTSEENTIKSVVDYFTNHCEQYEEDLKSVREVVVIVQHLKKES
jgi:hypothetical protein